MTRLFSGQRRGRGRFGPLASLTLTVILAGNVAAQSAGELRARAQAVDAGTSTESQRRAIEQLGELATSFIQLADKATLAGDPGAAGGELRAAYEAISGPLEAIHRSTAEATEGQVQKIIAADGDLEALYESPAYKEAQQTGAHALYFLNWLRYYGSRLYQGERRQRLLEQAQSGFSELTAGEESELSIESTLGRGLCQLDAGKLDAAIQDLRQVSESGKASAERRHKARLALLEAYSKRGHADGVLKLSQEMLADAATAEADWIRYARVRALLDKAKKTKGPAGDPLRQEAMALIDRLRRSGGAWEARVTELLHSELDNPEEWANKAGSPFAKWELAKMLAGKGDYSGALPLLQEVTASRDNALEAIQPEAQYLLGLAWFKASKMNEAAAALERALAAAKPSFAGEAAYLRFKAVEAMVASEPQSVDPARYEAALRGYLDGYPDHKSAFEARYRLGELYQAQQKFGEAIAEYRQVKGDPGFELQARFAMLQCGFELYPSTTAGERPQRLAEIDAGLRQFLSDAAKLDRKAAAQLPLAQMQAKAAVMEAVLRKLQPQPDFAAVVTALGEFETRYPQQTELLPQVVKLRMEAYQRLGDVVAARREVEHHGALLADQLGAGGLEEMAVAFIRAGARDKASNEAAQQVALALYQHLPGGTGGSERKALTMARLYENTGERAKAAELYRQVLAEKGGSTSAMRGLARIAEAEQRLPEALDYWRKLGSQVRPGDLPWYEANYEIARVAHLHGDKAGACKTLSDLRPAMPGLSDQDLRQKLTALYEQVC